MDHPPSLPTERRVLPACSASPRSRTTIARWRPRSTAAPPTRPGRRWPPGGRSGTSRSRRPRRRCASGCSASSRRARATRSWSSRRASGTPATRPPRSSARAGDSSPRTSVRRWSTSRAAAARRSASRMSTTGSWTPSASSSRPTRWTECCAAAATCSCRIPRRHSPRRGASSGPAGASRSPSGARPTATRGSRSSAACCSSAATFRLPSLARRGCSRWRATSASASCSREPASASSASRRSRCSSRIESLDEYVERARDTGGVFAKVWREVPDDEREEMESQLGQAFAPFAVDGRYEFPGVAVAAAAH